MDEPLAVDDRVKEEQGLGHAVLGRVLDELLIVAREGDAVEDRGDAFKAVNPLFPLRALSSDVKHVNL